MKRENILEEWLTKVLRTSDFKQVPLAGDASFRRYYRIWVGNRNDSSFPSSVAGEGGVLAPSEGGEEHTSEGYTSYVVMDAPPPESPRRFVEIAHVLAKQGLEVPRVLEAELEHGFLLLSDLGDRLYLIELNAEKDALIKDKKAHLNFKPEHVPKADALYQDAFKAMLKFPGFQTGSTKLPAFDQAFLQRQLGIFKEWYLKKHLAISDTTLKYIEEILTPIYAKLYEVIEEQPKVFVHKDYHSRNLMVTEKNNPGILDFQDAMLGPMTYDLVSLLQDCYIAWPRSCVVAWVLEFQIQAKEMGILKKNVSQEEFLRWFDWTGIKRHLKNLGIFARLHHRDNKSGYLKDIPQLLKYITEAAERYTELKPLLALFGSLPKSQLFEVTEIKCAQ